ncbi:MAG: serine/threonine protein kinase [Muribaculaceae bacterium]|nr:serine/threonine protein kinase [Muribaculaceae bacterium]
MNDMQESESGYIGNVADDSGIGAGITDVEIISVSGTNIIARGRRFGRYWLLKGIIPELRESLSARRGLQKEFELHSRLLHPNIVRVTALEDIPSLGICIVEEWVEGETLASILRNGQLSKRDRMRILREILSAVGYLHSMGVVHRDLKPQNIMVRKHGGEALLIDFGLADSGDYAELKQSAGTLGYISPEQFTGGGSRITDDIYSLGVIMKELCPEYSRIANRCIAPLDRRPKDTSFLLRMLDRADRRPKLVAWGIAATVLAAVVASVALHVRSVSAETEEAQVKIDTLTNSNTRNAARIAELEDLLNLATARLTTTRAVVSASTSDRGLRRRALVDAYRRLENEYISFDSHQMPHFADNGDIFVDSISALEDRCDLIARQSYDLKRFPELLYVDSTVMVGEMRSLAVQLLSVYFSVWQAQLERKRLAAQDISNR